MTPEEQKIVAHNVRIYVQSILRANLKGGVYFMQPIPADEEAVRAIVKEAKDYALAVVKNAKKVNGCSDCPFCYSNYSCEHPSNYDERGQINEGDISTFAAKQNKCPKWCPLDKEPITIIKA